MIDGPTLVCISPTTAFVGSASDSSTLCLLARHFELPFGIRRFAVPASFWESRLRNRQEDDGKDDQRGNDQHAALQTRLMAKPLDVSSYFWVGFYFILSGGGIIDVPLDFAWVLDVKRIIEQWIYVANEVPPDWMARRILISPSRCNCWRNKKQPKERRKRRQSNDAPRNQIGLLRQFGYLSLVKRTPLGIRFRPHRTLRWNAFAASLRTPRLRLRTHQTAHPAQAPSALPSFTLNLRLSFLKSKDSTRCRTA